MSWIELSLDGGMITGIAAAGGGGAFCVTAGDGAFCVVTIGAGFATLVAKGTVYDTSFDGELSAPAL